jgi:hypothetical protein
VLLVLAACALAPAALRATPMVYGVEFVTNGNAGVVDLANGSFNVVGQVGPYLINDIAFSPAYVLYGIRDTSELVRIDPSTGQVTDVMAVPSGLETLDFRPSDGVLFAATSSALFTINLSTDTTTLVGSYGLSFQGQNIRFDQYGNLYTTDTSSTTGVYLVNTSTGAAALEFTVPFGALALGYAGGNLYGVGIAGIGGQNNLILINPTTQTGTLVLNSFPSVDFSEIPEPGVAWLCGLGLAVLLLRSRLKLLS